MEDSPQAFETVGSHPPLPQATRLERAPASPTPRRTAPSSTSPRRPRREAEPSIPSEEYQKFGGKKNSKHQIEVRAEAILRGKTSNSRLWTTVMAITPATI